MKTGKNEDPQKSENVLKKGVFVKVKYLNILFSIALIVFACIFYKAAGSFKMLPGQADIGPKAFPRFVCICLIILAVLLIIEQLKKNEDTVIQLFNLKFVIGVATAVLYFALFKTVGFVLCSMVSIFVMEILLINEPLKKAWPLVTAVAVIAPILIQLIFGTALKVPLPAGLLSFIF